MTATTQGLNYRGFTARVYYDEEEGLVLGHVPTSKGSIEFRCTSIAAVQPEMHKVVDAFLRDHPDAKPGYGKR